MGHCGVQRIERIIDHAVMSSNSSVDTLWQHYLHKRPFSIQHSLFSTSLPTFPGKVITCLALEIIWFLQDLRPEKFFITVYTFCEKHSNISAAAVFLNIGLDL